jgi:hypothetical protein
MTRACLQTNVVGAQPAHIANTQRMDLLLAGRPEPWAVLAANPAALARRIYQRWGWRPLGPTRPAGMPAMEVLGLPLRRGR